MLSRYVRYISKVRVQRHLSRRQNIWQFSLVDENIEVENVMREKKRASIPSWRGRRGGRKASGVQCVQASLGEGVDCTLGILCLWVRLYR